MDVTTEYRSHWVAADGSKHATSYVNPPDGKTPWTGSARRTDLQPVLNIAELREYIELSVKHLPGGANNSAVWYARQIVERPKLATNHLVTEMCRELTELIPLYHEQWRAPFVAMRERHKAVP